MVDIFTLCDSAQDYNGKLVICGAFNILKLNSIPNNIVDLTIVSRFSFEKKGDDEIEVEVGIKKYKTEEFLIKPIKTKLKQNEIKGQFVSSNMIINIRGIAVTSAGEYTAYIKIGENMHTSMLKISWLDKDNLK